MSIFDHIISAFYQVDLHVAASIPMTPNRSNVDIEATEAPVECDKAVDKVLDHIQEQFDSVNIIERKVQYGRYMLRLTFSKEKVSYSKLWRILLGLRQHGLIHKYVYRHMDMEEALSTIIANEKQS